MITRARNYPHPVLTPLTEDVSPNTFELSLASTADPTTYFLDVSFFYENETLASLVQAGVAAHVVHIECKRNFYREIFELRSPQGRLTVASHEIFGRVEVSGFIVAAKPISDYVIDGSHSDYGNATFDIHVGDVLAVAPSVQFDAYLEYDPLKRLSSILDIRRGESSVEGPMEVAFDDHRIVVRLSQPDYDRYSDLKADPALGPLLANQVVIPALLEAFHYIKETEEDDIDVEMDRRWYRSVVKKLSDDGIDLRSMQVSALDAVQHVLRLPLRRSLTGLIQLNPLES